MNDFYVIGEWHAEHYLILLGCTGFCNWQWTKQYTGYALGTGIIKESDYKSISTMFYPAYELAIKLCGTSKTVSCLASCHLRHHSQFNHEIARNYYDIRKQCEGSSLCYDFSSPFKRHLAVRPKAWIEPRWPLDGAPASTPNSLLNLSMTGRNPARSGTTDATRRCSALPFLDRLSVILSISP
ncbi:unnamed protein product [Musa hybrid cultivar]